MNNSWFPQNSGCEIIVDDYSRLPSANIASIDIETDETEGKQRKIVCIGIAPNRYQAFIYFDIRPELIAYLRKLNMICHDGKSAEIPWLNDAYGNFSIDQLYFDTKIAAYVLDSTKKNYALKPLVEEYLGAKYPTYSEIVGSEENIKEACEKDKTLMVDRKNGQVFPKKLTLDKLSKEVVAAYNGSDCIYTYRLWEYLRKSFTSAQKVFFSNLEFPTTKLIARMEAKGIKIDTKEIRRIHNETSKERRKAKQALYKEAGESFNPNSPKQVLEVLRGRGLQISSTGEDALIKYQSDPVVRLLLKFRGLQKICSTYTIPLYFNAVKSGDSRIHTRFGQNTITGRLSSSDPINLQNQPPSVRSGFVAGDGYSFCDADWRALEIYLPAHFSGDRQLIDDIHRTNGKIHLAIGARLFGEAIWSLPEKEQNEKKKVAKEALLTVTNSGTFKSLSKTLQCSEKEAKEFEQAVIKMYPEFYAWKETTKKIARQQKGISTYFGRWVDLPALAAWCGRSGCPVFGEGGYFCKPCFQRQETEKQAISVKVQGTGGDLIKMAALRLYKEYGYVPNALVHDEILMETLDSEIEQTTERVRYVMQNLWLFTVPLKAEIKIAKNWLGAH